MKKNNNDIDVLLIYPWGNMRDYFKWLNSNLSLSNKIFKPQFGLFALILFASKIDLKHVDDGIAFQLLRKKGKIQRTKKAGKMRLTLQKAFYRLKYMGIFGAKLSRV